MATLPSIKGSIFQSVVEDVGKLLESGRLSQRELSRWLRSDDLPLLERSAVVCEWYDVRAYGRLLDLLRDVEGGGSNEYLRKRGAKNARRLLDAGLYQQMEYLQATQVAQQTEPKARFEAFGRDLARLTTLSRSILSFSRWVAKPDPERERHYLIEVSEARDYPEQLCWTTDGFINEMARQHKTPDLWTWTRPNADAIRFRTTRAV